MSAALHLPVLNTQTPYMLKDKAGDSFAPAFTAVNSRGSPPSPRVNIISNGMSPHQSPSHHPNSGSPGNDYRSGSTSSSASSSGSSSPDSPNNKKRRSDSPPEHHSNSRTMEAPQHRPLPSFDRASQHERRWTAEPQSDNGYREPINPRPLEPIHGSMPPMSIGHAHMDEHNSIIDSSNMSEVNRAGVQLSDAKKRKRQFANRTKTGCGTCRQRKKKCDEAKPECNNCTRGGFVCQGYASKVPWPKSSLTSKPPPPLQAKEQMHDGPAPFPRCPGCNQMHVPQCDPARGNSQPYPDPRSQNGADGARARPIVVDDQERKPSAPTTWNGNGWNEAPRVSYAEHPAPVVAQYPQPPVQNHERTPSHDHHMPQPQGPPPPPPPPRPSNPRVYHHTPSSMSHTAPHPAAGAEAHHQAPQQSRPPPMSQPTSAPATAPQPHYPPPPRKTEKEKMLHGEPFMPFDEQLMEERAHCTGAVYSFNCTASPSVQIGRGDRERNFKRIVAAGWIHPRHMDRRPGVPNGGHCGGNVTVATPFHCEYGYNISLGDNVVIGPHCQLLDSTRIAIGRNTRIGARVTISTIKTPTDTKSTKGNNGTEIAQQVYIGENVYIGDGVIIEAGIRIGNNAIIRSGSVVVRDIGPDSVAHGNPAL